MISSASRLQKHPLALQATIRRVCAVWWAVFFFPLLPSFTFLCAPLATIILKHLCLCFPLLKQPLFQKMCHLFHMIGLDLQERLPPTRPVCCKTDGREAEGGVESSTQKGEISSEHFSSLFRLCSPWRFVCVFEGVRERGRDIETQGERGKLAEDISPQSSRLRHLHSRWSGSAAIWRPWWWDNLRYLRTPNFVYTDLLKAMWCQEKRQAHFWFKLGKGKAVLDFSKSHAENTSVGTT